MRAVGISIIICTYNRANLLGELLTSIERELTSKVDLEVIVVDNNCTDHTATVVRAFEGRLPALQYVVEAQQGLSFARNRGAATASNEYLLYLDDETTLCDAFLERAEIVLRRFQPDLFGGPTVPRVDRDLPEWFDLGTEIRQLERFSGFSATSGVSGANFGIKRSVLQRLGPFDTSLGMVGSVMAFGEDRELVERYRSRTPPAEQRIYYAVELVVQNYILPYKLDVKYQLKRKYENARSQELVFVNTGKRSLARSLIYACAHLVLLPFRAVAIATVNGFGSSARFEMMYHAYGVAGRARGILDLMQERLTQSFRNGARRFRKRAD
jgi:glycosyltransferase involved in cell wall biosynthesis